MKKKKQLSRKIDVALALVAILALATLVYTLKITQVEISTSGVVAEGELSANPNSIPWGTVTIGIPVKKNVTLTNNGTSTVSNLNMTTADINGLSNFSLTWTLEGQDLGPSENKTASFTLTIHNYTETTFSFSIIVVGTY